jgi:hypothetical protein
MAARPYTARSRSAQLVTLGLMAALYVFQHWRPAGVLQICRPRPVR